MLISIGLELWRTVDDGVVKKKKKGSRRSLLSLEFFQSEEYRFATAEQISILGINTEKRQLCELIGNPVMEASQKTESQLLIFLS